MFKRSFAAKDRAGKATKLSKAPKRSFRDDVKKRMLEERLDSPSSVGEGSPVLTSAIITLVVGPDQRLFAAHEDVLCHSPFFAEALRGQFFEQPNARRITLPDDEPEAFSCVLEYLYKGDYYPRLLHDKKRNSWYLEDSMTSPVPGASPSSLKSNGGRAAAVQPTMYHSAVGDVVLRDTVVYCAADRFGLEELKRLALRKQGLQAGIEVGTILRSARFAYANTPDNDSRLRAHYLALIIRSRRTFKRSGTMQMEMEMGGRLFFDLFVAMCNHMDDLAELGGETAKSPKGV